MLLHDARCRSDQASLAAAITAAGPGVYQLAVTPTPAVLPGATITFRLFIPAGSTVNWMQPYAIEGAPNFGWTGTAVPIGALSLGAWTTLTVQVPATSAAIASIGVQFNVTAAWTGTVNIDAVTW